MNATMVGLLFGSGLGLLAYGVAVPPAKSASGRSGLWSRWIPITVAALAAGFVVWLMTSLAALAAATMAATLVMCWMFDRERGQSLDDVTATASTVARWVESVHDQVVSGSVTPETAMTIAARQVDGPHRDAFRRFADDMEHFPLEQSGQALVERIRHPLADKAVAALVVARNAGGIPTSALAALASAAQDEVNSSRQLAASLSRGRASARLVAIAGVVVTLATMLLFRNNLGVYRTWSGQVILTLGLAGIGWCWWKVWDLSRVQKPARVLRVDRFRERS